MSQFINVHPYTHTNYAGLLLEIQRVHELTVMNKVTSCPLQFKDLNACIVIYTLDKVNRDDLKVIYISMFKLGKYAVNSAIKLDNKIASMYCNLYAIESVELLPPSLDHQCEPFNSYLEVQDSTGLDVPLITFRVASKQSQCNYLLTFSESIGAKASMDTLFSLTGGLQSIKNKLNSLYTTIVKSANLVERVELNLDHYVHSEVFDGYAKLTLCNLGISDISKELYELARVNLSNTFRISTPPWYYKSPQWGLGASKVGNASIWYQLISTDIVHDVYTFLQGLDKPMNTATKAQYKHSVRHFFTPDTLIMLSKYNISARNVQNMYGLFDPDLDIQAHLLHNSLLSEIRYKLVPQQISEELFWKNYFWRVNCLLYLCESTEQKSALLTVLNSPIVVEKRNISSNYYSDIIAQCNETILLIKDIINDLNNGNYHNEELITSSIKVAESQLNEIKEIINANSNVSSYIYNIQVEFENIIPIAKQLNIHNTTTTNTVDNTTTNIVDSTAINTVDSTAINTVDNITTNIVDSITTTTLDNITTNTVDSITTNIVDSTATNTVDSTAINTVDSTATNTVDSTAINTVDNTATNIVDNTATTTLDNITINTVDSTATNIVENKVDIFFKMPWEEDSN